MTDVENRLCRLEQQIRAAESLLAAIQIALAQLSQAVRTQQTGGYGGGGGGSGLVYTIAPVAIVAGGSVSGQTVSTYVAGTGSVALPGTYTVFNLMASATVATSGKTIIVGQNPDGTFTAITQSC